MTTIYIAEDHPVFDDNNPHRPRTDEDHAMACVMVDSGTDEIHVRHRLAMHLIRCTAGLDIRRQRTYVAASNAITDGVDAVQIGTRVFRIRTRPAATEED